MVRALSSKCTSLIIIHFPFLFYISTVHTYRRLKITRAKDIDRNNTEKMGNYFYKNNSSKYFYTSNLKLILHSYSKAISNTHFNIASTRTYLPYFLFSNTEKSQVFFPYCSGLSFFVLLFFWRSAINL